MSNHLQTLQDAIADKTAQINTMTSALRSDDQKLAANVADSLRLLSGKTIKSEMMPGIIAYQCWDQYPATIAVVTALVEREVMRRDYEVTRANMEAEAAYEAETAVQTGMSQHKAVTTMLALDAPSKSLHELGADWRQKFGALSAIASIKVLGVMDMFGDLPSRAFHREVERLREKAAASETAPGKLLWNKIADAVDAGAKVILAERLAGIHGESRRKEAASYTNCMPFNRLSDEDKTALAYVLGLVLSRPTSEWLTFHRAVHNAVDAGHRSLMFYEAYKDALLCNLFELQKEI